VLSANVWGHNPSNFLAVGEILKRDADAVLLQEIDGEVFFALPRLRARYPHSSRCLGSGVQIFLKTPILAQGCGLGSKSRADLDLAWVQTTAPDGNVVTLATTHFSQPLPPRYHEADCEALVARLAALPGEALILAGDFNATPWSFCLKRLDRMLKPLTRRSIAWASYPARLNRWHWRWPIPFLPIDQIYAGPDWSLVRLTRVWVPGSDHFATEASFRRAPSRRP
jgi:endonuclease/exonuclease/phosphatase (EEP) superfamily protein YafD